jgi:hypothetical protein
VASAAMVGRMPSQHIRPKHLVPFTTDVQQPRSGKFEALSSRNRSPATRPLARWSSIAHNGQVAVSATVHHSDLPDRERLVTEPSGYALDFPTRRLRGFLLRVGLD